MSERKISIGQPSKEVMDKLQPPPKEIGNLEADLYSVGGDSDFIAGIEYDQDMTGMMEDLAFKK